MKTCLLISSVAFATASMTALAESTSPWLPIPGQLSLTLNYTQQSGDSSYINQTDVPVIEITGGEAEEFERTTTSLIINYGISDSVALDAVIGYGEVDAGVSSNDSDRSDAIIGLSWRIVDEDFSILPTITTRVGAIIGGDYAVDQLASIGDGQNGLDVSILLGQNITNTFAINAEIGHQTRDGNIPDATYYGVNLSLYVLDKIGLNIGYSVNEYGGELDLAGPGFTPARFQEVRAERSLAKAGINYSFANNHGIAVNYATIVDGRNTIKDDSIVGVSYTYAF